jgi:hypothetical protein
LSIEQAKYILTKPIHSSQHIEKRNEDGSYVFSIRVVLNIELYSVFMSYGPGVKILSPRIAVAYMRDMLRKAADMYVNPK